MARPRRVPARSGGDAHTQGAHPRHRKFVRRPVQQRGVALNTSPILLLDNVSRVHGHRETAVRALDGVTLTVHAGELVALMGPSGSGQTTLLNLAGGLDQPTAGQVFVEGADVGAMS